MFCNIVVLWSSNKIIHQYEVMKFKTFLFTLFVCIQFTFSQNATISSEIKDHIKARVDQGFNPSIALAYIEGDEISYFNYGKTDLDNGKDVNENTVYEIGSISKVFTTILLADEVVKGNMKLTDPASKYLPKEVSVPQRNGKVITLKDLATHTSGLPRMPENISPADFNNPYIDYTAALLYDYISSYELPRDIGSQYEYSNLGMGLLGHILELHISETYENLVINRIAKPLGMNDTRILFTDSMKERLALGHNDQLEVVANWDFTTLAGAGGIRSTLNDMVKFIKANISTDTSLHKAMKLSHEIAFSNENQNFIIALGWHFANNNTITWHNGGTGGYSSFNGFLNNRAVVALTNSTNSVDAIGLKLLDASIILELPTITKFPDVIEVSTEVLDSYVGKYELAPEFTITVSRKENRLFAQATGQPEFEIFPSTEVEFFLKVVEASVTFNKNEEGVIISLTLHQGGQDTPGIKIK